MSERLFRRTRRPASGPVPLLAADRLPSSSSVEVGPLPTQRHHGRGHAPNTALGTASWLHAEPGAEPGGTR